MIISKSSIWKPGRLKFQAISNSTRCPRLTPRQQLLSQNELDVPAKGHRSEGPCSSLRPNKLSADCRYSTEYIKTFPSPSSRSIIQTALIGVIVSVQSTLAKNCVRARRAFSVVNQDTESHTKFTNNPTTLKRPRGRTPNIQ